MTKPCPRCNGRGFTVEPFIQRSDQFCRWCGGKGQIDPEKICKCGRPAVQILDGKEVCIIGDCGKVVETGDVVQTFTRWTEEDEERWEEFQRTGSWVM
jgi:hypothetical protein